MMEALSYNSYSRKCQVHLHVVALFRVEVDLCESCYQ